MNDNHRHFVIQVSLSADLVSRVDARAKTLGITPDDFIARAIEGALPAPDIRPAWSNPKPKKRGKR